jgi:hypothetical protein
MLEAGAIDKPAKSFFTAWVLTGAEAFAELMIASSRSLLPEDEFVEEVKA